MGFSGYTHYDFHEIAAETEKAFLIRLDIDDEEVSVWVPKSQIADADDYAKGDTDGSISVSDWFAKKNGWIEGN